MKSNYKKLSTNTPVYFLWTVCQSSWKLGCVRDSHSSLSSLEWFPFLKFPSPPTPPPHIHTYKALPCVWWRCQTQPRCTPGTHPHRWPTPPHLVAPAWLQVQSHRPRPACQRHQGPARTVVLGACKSHDTSLNAPVATNASGNQNTTNPGCQSPWVASANQNATKLGNQSPWAASANQNAPKPDCQSPWASLANQNAPKPDCQSPGASLANQNTTKSSCQSPRAASPNQNAPKPGCQSLWAASANQNTTKNTLHTKPGNMGGKMLLRLLPLWQSGHSCTEQWCS